MRRLLNVTQLSHLQKLSSMVISLDADKAFDRVEWHFLFSTLNAFGLWDAFSSWVRLLYNRPLAAVRISGQLSSYFPWGRGTRQGLSPLLFAIAIKPLAEAIRNSPDITGIPVGGKNHKIALYADDILLFITDPTKFIPAVLEAIDQFSTFSGYKINSSNSEVMLLGNSSWPSSCPFKWWPTGFTYLGISITLSLEEMYKANFEHLFKMNILPRLLYHFQMSCHGL